MFGNTTQSASPRPLRAAIGAGIAGLVLGATGSVAAPAFAGDTYKVASGDTLAKIAQEHGYDGASGWRRIFDANPKLTNPDLIVPGQKLTIPSKGEKVQRRQLPAEPAPRREAAAASRSSAVTVTSAPTEGVWTRLAACESGGNWAANTGNGYYGGLQFSLSSWRAVGGSGYPHQASAATQIAMGQRLQASQGWGAWPGCAAELGLR